MKPIQYIYKEVEKFNNGMKPLEATLNEENTSKDLHHIIELDDRYIIIWRD